MNDLTFTTSNAFLHHGIQGQKWGVRNGPPYPLERAKEAVKETVKKVEKVAKGSEEKLKKAYATKKADVARSAGKIVKDIGSLAKNITVGNSSYKTFMELTGNMPISLVLGSAVAIGTGTVTEDVKKILKDSQNVYLESKELMSLRNEIRKYDYRGAADSQNSRNEYEKNRIASGMSEDKWDAYNEFMRK